MGTILGKFQYWYHPHNLNQTNHQHYLQNSTLQTAGFQEVLHAALRPSSVSRPLQNSIRVSWQERRKLRWSYHILPNYLSTIILNQGLINVQINQEPSQNSRRQKGGMKQVPQWKPTNIRHHRTKFSYSGDLAPGIWVPLPYKAVTTW